MKYAAKMSLVPLNEVKDSIVHLSEIDMDMSNVLNNKELTQDDKIKLYNQLLSKYIHVEDNIEKRKDLEQPNMIKENVKIEKKKTNKKRKTGDILKYTGNAFPNEVKTSNNKLKWTTY